MQVKNARFELTAVRPDQYPIIQLPEVAFAGRSNVGKSSVINLLINRKNLARVGASPGMTKEINFYNIDEKLFFVDLPGYGYAGVSKTKKSSWETVIETYLNLRIQLKLIILLVDIRHAPSADDKLMHEWLKARGVPFAVAASKVDKISRNQINSSVQMIRKELGLAAEVPVIPFSSESRAGKDELWKLIDLALQMEVETNEV